MRHTRVIAVVGLCCIMGGCAAGGSYRHATYTVRAQDTLYDIAWRHDVDFRDLAKWNNIGSDYRLVVGQVLVLEPPGPVARAASGAGASSPSTAAPAAGRVPAAVAIAPPPTASRPQNIPRVSKPKPLDAPAGTAPQGGIAAADAAAPTVRPAAGGVGAKWAWPTDQSSPPRPVPGGGILLFGRLGQDVRAAGPGRVVYTGSGIRGYGNLIIVKHGDNLLSSYAHNSEMLVHDGQEVLMGQTIAHMGTAAHQTSALYFEIRLNGKPVDPLRYLPVAK